MRKIYLVGKRSEGKFALVDDDRYDLVMAYSPRWYFNKKGYAEGVTYSAEHYRKFKRGSITTFMHIVILGRVPGLEIDHINQDKLDNRVANLRHVTHRENMSNQKRVTDRGIHAWGTTRVPRLKSKPWMARVDKTFLGYYSTQLAAHLVAVDYLKSKT